MHSFRASNSSIARPALALSLLLFLVATGANFSPNNDVDPPPTGDSSLVVSASVTPTSAPIGQPFDFHVTVTNTGTETKRFWVDGCPVFYVIDQIYSPNVPCPALAREIVLEPGDNITFGPENDPVLHFDPHHFPIGPGEHSADLTVTGLWTRVSVSFHVQAPATDLAYASGRVMRADGSIPSDFGADLVSRNSNGESAYHTAVTREGYFFFENVTPGTYLLRVGNDADVWWYPGVLGPNQAKPITLAAGQYLGNLDMVIPGGPVPGPFPLSGQVFEATADSSNATPLANAIVVAIPLQAWPPDDSTGVGPGVGGGYPSPDGRYVAYTDANGIFTLDLLQGGYRLLAGKQGSHRYQYFNHVYAFGEAAQISWPNRQTPPRFDLPVLSANRAVIAGQVLGYNPLADAMPHPLEGAAVEAIPVFPSASLEVLIAHTGADGTFHLEVPSDTPYRVAASADGYESLYFQNAMNNVDATPVDVSPGSTTSGIDFALPQILPGFDKGAIQGLVLRRLSENCGPDAAGVDSCFVPAAGALVRITPAFPTLVAVEYQTYTGTDGRFKIDGLLAQADGYLSYYVSAQIDNEEPAYYPGGVPFNEAQTLAVFPGQISDAGTIVVPGKLPVGPGFLAGNVTDFDNQPIDHALVRVFVAPDSPWGFVARAFTNPDGSFYVTDLPAGASVIVSAEAPSYVPAYYPNVYQWTLAQRVLVAGPNTRMAPLHVVLNTASTGPFIQAGFVVVKPESVIADTGWVDPNPLASRRIAPASIMARFGKLTYEVGLRDAFFYLVNAEVMGPMERPIAGSSTGDNGASILRGLPEGVYIAYADRPGFDRAYFSEAGDNPTLITLNNTTPAVLAWIALHPKDGNNVGPPGEDAAMLHNLTNVPNPFGAQTAIRYTLKAAAPVTVQVFDHSGRLVRTIVRSNSQVAGPHEVSWDARDDIGRRATKGVYFARILAGQEAFARKMLLLP